MQISDSDKPKLIVLICLIILVLAYSGYYMKSSAKKPVQEPKVVENNKKISAEQIPPSEGINNSVLLASVRGRDPFEPQVKPSENKPNVIKPGKIKLPLFGNNNLPPLPIQIKPSNGNQVVVVPEPLPNFKLVGIITGNQNLAVIKGDSASRYMVREGQYIENKYLVTSISSTSVSIKYRDRITVLKLGGKDAVQN